MDFYNGQSLIGNQLWLIGGYAWSTSVHSRKKKRFSEWLLAAPLFVICYLIWVRSKADQFHAGLLEQLKNLGRHLSMSFPLIHLLPSIHPNHDFLCHFEILDRLCARWSSRNCHGSPYLPNTSQRQQEQVSRCSRSSLRKQHSGKHVSHYLRILYHPSYMLIHR